MSKDFPAAKDGDSENLAWLRSTAEALWGKGERDDALVWLERAARDAEAEERPARATELREAAAQLATGPKPQRPKSVGATTLVSDRDATLGPGGLTASKPKSADEPSQLALSTSDLISDEPAMVTRKFDYPDGVDPRAVASAMVPEAPRLPDDVLPAIRVWITKAGGKVVPADGARPSGVVDAMLVSVVPGVDLRAALKGA